MLRNALGEVFRQASKNYCFRIETVVGTSISSDSSRVTQTTLDIRLCLQMSFAYQVSHKQGELSIKIKVTEIRREIDERNSFEQS